MSHFHFDIVCTSLERRRDSYEFMYGGPHDAEHLVQARDGEARALGQKLQGGARFKNRSLPT